LSAKLAVVVLRIVCVPLTVKLPVTTISSANVLAPATLCVPVVLTTELSTAKVPELLVIPSPPVK